MFNYIVKNLAPFGYHSVKHTPGLWEHKTKSTTSTLCVDYFWIKSYSKEDKEHPLNALRTKYEISTDSKGEKYIGFNINCNYKGIKDDISMPGYVQKAFQNVVHEPSSRPHHAPHKWTAPAYRHKV